jgi:REP element-mobilizing transposase RayT
LHIIWATIARRPLLEKPAAAKLSAHLREYAIEKGIYMKINFVNADHTHVLVDLPASKAIEEVVQLLKGGSSHWVNENNLVPGKFGWQRGYGAFSVSHSAVDEVCAYIANQEEHHRKKTFAEELKLFVERYGLKWHEEENR